MVGEEASADCHNLKERSWSGWERATAGTVLPLRHCSVAQLQVDRSLIIHPHQRHAPRFKNQSALLQVLQPLLEKQPLRLAQAGISHDSHMRHRFVFLTCWQPNPTGDRRILLFVRILELRLPSSLLHKFIVAEMTGYLLQSISKLYRGRFHVPVDILCLQVRWSQICWSVLQVRVRQVSNLTLL